MSFIMRPVVLPVWQVVALTLISAAAGTVIISHSFKSSSKHGKDEAKQQKTGSSSGSPDENDAGNDEDEDDDDDDDDDEDESGEVEGDVPIINSYGPLNGPYKMVLVVNMSLQMGKGKIAAQCGHAALGAYRIAVEKCPTAVRWWLRMGQAKIAVKCDDDAQLEAIATVARAAGLVCCQIEDAGKTQIAAGSRTVLAIGPAPVSSFKGISEHLKLL
jgi:peptidyl-tRNA hydrolase, PTH2 family